MFVFRTFCCDKMNDLRIWLVVAIVHTLLLSANGANHRRTMVSQSGLPASKGGWRPVVGSGGLVYGQMNTAPLHAPYKIPVPVLDSYSHQSSARPLATRDAAKLTSIAQSYRPTTLRTVPSSSPGINQPVNSYHNPFALQNNGFSSYKFIQNFPVESVLVRNPHNQFSQQRPVYSKYPAKYNQNALQNAMLQQLSNIQPIHFGYATSKPLDMYGRPIEFARPSEVKKPQSNGLEVFKPQVFKLPDTDAASQSVNQQVRTAQQQAVATNIGNPYAQYTFQDPVFPLGSFGTFGVPQKGGDPFQFQTKTTYLPPQPTKQTIFNSFNYSPSFKTTQTPYSTTTPRIQTTANQLYFGTTYNDFKVTPAPQTKVYVPPKIDPNAGIKDGFKPSPQDPFSKLHHTDYNKISVTTYNPVQTTTLANNFYDYNFQQNPHLQNFYDQNYNYDRQKHRIHDSLAAGGNQQSSQQYANAPVRSELDGTVNAPYRPTYEVTETTESDPNAHTSNAPWTLTSQSYEYNNQKPTEEDPKKQEYTDSFNKPGTTTSADFPEEYAIVTEADKGHDNSLNYDSQVESQSRRPLGDDFEPIGKHKLKEYYYRVSTPSSNEFGTSRRTKKPTEAKLTTTAETTTEFLANKEKDETLADALPTLPPNLHFKRPQPSQEPLDKDRIRKRNKIRRRRPPQAHTNRFREETTTRKVSTTEAALTTKTDEVYTIRPRVRPTSESQPNLTTPTVTTDLTTSALPTISPTIPTIVKKKLAHRRPLTTPADKTETTTQSYYGTEDLNKESQIMKIGSRPQFPKPFKANLKSIDIPDFTHKQDEKDTPTSDVTVSLTDSLKTTVGSELDFSFHKDVKPIEAYKETTTELTRNYDTTEGTTTRSDTTTERIQRPRLRNKYNRTRFNVKDYRNRLGSTTSSTEKPVENTPKARFPHRRTPYSENDNESTTERKKFTPKDPRHKLNSTELNEQTEKEIHSFKNNRQRQTTVDNFEVTTARISPRIRNGQRRTRPTEEPTESFNPTTPYNKRIIRKKLKDSEFEESENIAVTETTVYDRNELTSERARSESAIMKIADKKHHSDQLEHLFEHSRRVSDLTLAASKDYNKPGMFKTVASNSRRIPNYFTIATDDPILPIEAFFPQLNQKKES